jgi:hypothetical protein
LQIKRYNLGVEGEKIGEVEEEFQSRGERRGKSMQGPLVGNVTITSQECRDSHYHIALVDAERSSPDRIGELIQQGGV